MYSILTISFTSIISDIWKKSNEQTPNRTLLCKKALHFIHKFRIFSGHHWNGIQTYFTIPLLCINKFQKSTQLQNCTPLWKKCTILELIFIFCSSKFVHKFAKMWPFLEPYGFILFIIKINSKFVHKFLKKCTNLELSLCET